MADAAAARRESRRRRILENSHNRLQFISGKSTEDKSCSPIRTIIEEISHRHCVNNGVIVTEHENIETFPTFPLISSQTSDVPVSDSEVVNDLAFSVPPSEESTCYKISINDAIIAPKYDIVILSIIIQILYSLVLVTDTTYIFLPVVIYSVTKMIYLPTTNNSTLLNTLLLLTNFSTSNMQRVMQIMQSFTFIFGDVCMFLFVTICIQSLCYLFGNSSDT